MKDYSKEHLKIIPTSVIDIAAQKKRVGENHSSISSRKNYSPFPVEVADLCYEFYLRDKQHIFDPFAGWGERGYYAKQYEKSYFGYDTSQKALDAAWKDYYIKNELGDTLIATIPHFNGLITCPPYFNLEKYEGNGLDKIKKWDDFIISLAEVFKRCYEAADADTTFCIMVGDWRKKGVYYDLVFMTEMIFKELGATILDKVVISRKNVSKIKIMLPQAKRLGYSVKVHENLLVFKKPI